MNLSRPSATGNELSNPTSNVRMYRVRVSQVLQSMTPARAKGIETLPPYLHFPAFLAVLAADTPPPKR
jgi:hypothetical protein